MSTEFKPGESERLFEEALLSLDRVSARHLFLELAGEAGAFPLVERLIVPSLERIGAGWEQGDYALSQVYMSGRICEELVNDILPPGSARRKHDPKMAIAVLDDYHFLGKRIVYCLLRASGFDLLDYGRVTVEEAVRRTRDDGLELLLLSVLMLRSALQVKEVRAGLTAAGLKTKILVGGAPFRFDTRLHQEVGADAMATYASEAVGIISRLGGERSGS